MSTRTIAVAVAAALLLTLCGCTMHQISDNLYVQGISIDFKEGRYTVYLNIFNPGDTSGAPEEPQGAIDNVLKSEGKSVADAIHNAQLSTPRRLDLSRNRVVVLSRDVLSHSLSDVLCFYGRFYQTRLSVLIFAFEGDVKDAMISSVNNAVNPIAALETLGRLNEKAGYLKLSTGLDLMVGLNEEPYSFMLPVLRKETGDPKAEESKGSNDSLKICGGALFRDSSYVGMVPLEVSMPASQILSQDGQDIVVARSDEQTNISVQTLDRSVSVRASYENERLVLHLRMEQGGFLVEIDGEQRELDETELKKMDEAYQAEVRRQMQTSVDRIVRREGCDIFGFARALHADEPDAYYKLVDNWSQAVQQAELDIKVEAHITRIGSLYRVT